jgi:serine/threonine protein phosphatase PrpC
MMRKLSLLLLMGACAIAIDQDLNYESNYGIAEMQGRRPTMEDEVDCTINDDHAFFAVYDGHGGKAVATFARDNLRKNCALDQATTDDAIKETLTKGFIQTHAELSDAISYHTGSTATVAVIKNGQIYVANTGDSRTVLCRGENALALSDDHKPDRPDERKRIEDLGGRIVFWGTWRVEAQLALSRALGDRCMAPYVIPNPEITQTVLTPADEFLILGCDGVWDVFNNQDAVDLVRVELKNNGDDCQKAAEALMNAAYEKGSTDNISVIIVNLKSFIQE